MKQVIRNGVFETNSSSTHSLVMTTKELFEKWKNGEVWYAAYDAWGTIKEGFYTLDELFNAWKLSAYHIKETTKEEFVQHLNDRVYHYGIYTYESYNNTFEDLEYNITSKTINGVDIVALSHYGYD